MAPAPLLLTGSRGWPRLVGPQRELLVQGLQGSRRGLLGSQVGQRGLQVLGPQRGLGGSQAGQRGLQVLGPQRGLGGSQAGQRGLQVLGPQRGLGGSQVGQRGLQVLGPQRGLGGSQVGQRGLQVLGPQRGLQVQGLSRGFAKVAKTRSSREVKEAEDAAPVFQYVGERSKRKDRVFVWGFCHAGALGIPSFIKPDASWKKRRRIQPTPYRLDTAEKISSAACGYGFTLISSKTTDITKVWGMGLNKDSQLGFQRSRKDQTKGYEYVLEPSPIPLPLDTPQETRILQVACGRAHSLILTDKEGVFSMGNNSYGQCGRKVTEGEIYSESHLIHRLQKFKGRVAQIVCGQDHSLFRTERGEVYSCGWGADGQTGLGHYNITSVPTKLGGDITGVNIVHVATYGDSCLAVSDEGDLFGWGNSEYMQLASITETTQVNVPRHLPFKIGKIKDAACGGTGNAVVNEEGNVFVWGYGILGKGPNLMETATPEMIPPTLFGLSDFSPDTRVSRIRCGLSQFAALNNRGELFMWGKNIRGCLGIGRMEDQYFPWRVTIPGEVVDVACGVDHMVTLVKSFI